MHRARAASLSEMRLSQCQCCWAASVLYPYVHVFASRLERFTFRSLVSRLLFGYTACSGVLLGSGVQARKAASVRFCEKVGVPALPLVHPHNHHERIRFSRNNPCVLVTCTHFSNAFTNQRSRVFDMQPQRLCSVRLKPCTASTPPTTLRLNSI